MSSAGSLVWQGTSPWQRPRWIQGSCANEYLSIRGQISQNERTPPHCFLAAHSYSIRSFLLLQPESYGKWLVFFPCEPNFLPGWNVMNQRWGDASWPLLTCQSWYHRICEFILYFTLDLFSVKRKTIKNWISTSWNEQPCCPWKGAETQKETHLPTINFQVWTVSFREGIFASGEYFEMPPCSQSWQLIGDRLER